MPANHHPNIAQRTCFTGSDRGMIVVLLIALISGYSSLFAGESEQKTSTLERLDLLTAVDDPPPGVHVAQLVFDSARKTLDLRGTVVVCPGQNGDGARNLLDGVWLNWAEKNGLAVVAIHFQSPDELLKKNQGYFQPDDLLIRLFLHGLKTLNYPTSSLYFSGFSGGARFTAGFLEKKPELVTGFCVQAAQVWPDSASFWSSDLPPGLVACGDLDAPRLSATLAFFQKGRRAKAPWIWTKIRHRNHRPSPELEDLARDAFVIWADQHPNPQTQLIIDHTRQASISTSKQSPAIFTSVFPCDELSSSWRALHRP